MRARLALGLAFAATLVAALPAAAHVDQDMPAACLGMMCGAVCWDFLAFDAHPGVHWHAPCVWPSCASAFGLGLWGTQPC